MPTSLLQIVRAPIFFGGLLIFFGLVFGHLVSTKAVFGQAEPEHLVRCFTQEDTRSIPDTSCLKSTVQKLLNKYSPRQLFTYLSDPSLIKKLDSTYVCNMTGHVIGETLYEKAGSVESAFAACDSRCSSSCYHGAIIAAVTHETGSKEVGEALAHESNRIALETVGKKYCTSGFVCHGLGHLLRTSFDSLSEALEVCDTISGNLNSSDTFANALIRHKRQACYEGVFMEEIDNTAAAQLQIESPEESRGISCTDVAPEYRLACFRYEQDILDVVGAGTESSQTSRLASVCSSYKGSDRVSCFEGAGYLYGISHYASPTTASICSTFGDERDQIACTVGVVLGLGANGEFDRSMRYCGGISKARERQNLCYQAAFQSVEYMTKNKPDAILNMCKKNANSEDCANQFNRYMNQKSQIPFFYMDQLFEN